MDKMYENYIKEIAEASRNNELVIFIGAGFSKEVNPNNMTWSKITQKMKEIMGLKSSENDNLKIAQMYYEEYKEIGLTRFLEENVSSKIIDEEPLKFLYKLNPYAMITTNWDDILVNYAQEKDYYDWEAIASDKQLLSKKKQSRYVLKMHGDIANRNYVFTENSYNEYEKNFKLIINRIKDLLTNRTILFLGYSFNDPDIKQILNFFDNKTDLLMYFFESEHNEKISKAYLDYYESYGLKVITPSLIGISQNDIKTFLKIINNVEGVPELVKITFIDKINKEKEILKNQEIIICDYIYRIFKKHTIDINFYFDGMTMVLNCVDTKEYKKIVEDVEKFKKNNKNGEKELEEYFSKFMFCTIILIDWCASKKTQYILYKKACIIVNNDLLLFSKEVYNKFEENFGMYLDKARKESDYLKLLFAKQNNEMFYYIDKWTRKDENAKFKKYKKNDVTIKEFYNSLSSKNKECYEPVYDFLTDKTFLQLYQRVDNDILNYKENVNHWGYQEDYFSKIFNYILFANENNYLLEFDSVFEKLTYKIFYLYVIRNTKIELSNFHLYIILKILRIESIGKIISLIEEKITSKIKNIVEVKINQEYLLDELANSIDKISSNGDKESFFNEINTPTKCAEKIIFILSLSKDEKTIIKVIKRIIQMLKKPIAWDGMYKTVSYYLRNNAKFIDKNERKEIIDLLIEKKIGNIKSTFYDIENIDNNTMYNIFTGDKDFVYDNIILVDKLIKNMDEHVEEIIKDRTKSFIKYFLMCLKVVSIDEIKEKIDVYYKKILTIFDERINAKEFNLGLERGLSTYNIYLFLNTQLDKNNKKINYEIIDRDKAIIHLSSELTDTLEYLVLLKADKRYINIIKELQEKTIKAFNEFFKK